MYSRVTMNLVGAQKRYETYEGKKHLVLPTVMMTEGVWNGSQGPLYYSSTELSKFPVSWNHKPVMLHHPSLNGEGTTACDPGVLERQKIGLLFNSGWEDKLKSETWVDEAKLQSMNPNLLERINRNETIEVSTGLYHDLEEVAGTWNGKKYIGSVKNIQPDHLAVLPDQKGACSTADGAGLIRNADELSYDDIRTQIRDLLKDPKFGYSYCYVCDLYSKYAIFEKDDKTYKVGYKIKSGKVALVGETEEVRKQTSYVTVNGEALTKNNEEKTIPLIPQTAEEISEPLRKQQMQGVLAHKFGTGDTPWDGWVQQLFANYVIWFKDGKQFRLPYTYSDDKITFSGEPEELPLSNKESDMTVQKVVTPAPTKNVIADVSSLGGGSDGQSRTTDGGARSSMVNKAVAKLGEQHRAYIEGMSDELLGKVAGDVKMGADQEIIPYGYSGVGDRSNVHNTEAKNGIESLDPELREVVQEALITNSEEKKRLTGIITNSKGNRFNEKWLMTQKLPLLRGLAALASGTQQQKPIHNYSGQAAEVPMFVDITPQTTNQQGNTQNSQNLIEGEEILRIPTTMNWDDEKASVS